MTTSVRILKLNRPTTLRLHHTYCNIHLHKLQRTPGLTLRPVLLPHRVCYTQARKHTPILSTL